MERMVITKDVLKKAVISVLFDRNLCPSQQAHGISARIWKLIEASQPAVEAEREKTAPA